VVAGMLVGTLCSFLVRLLDPAVLDKAGPDWLWSGGRHDLVRSLYFRPNGSFRRYGRLALVLTMAGGIAALYLIMQRV
jgi:ABC-type enterochelin transport system permease subunit